ncbi:ComEC/Rec2 family competence protein [Pontivivens insulae]|uniref:ComE operon protein 3 n=1 Tax=Pontivivens insulae TaxID=1639689 RepID=A0A2R8AAR5_9RHOB|nr:ComEC/Rec2 family competence protein [Pontivivens insulae]RED13221.1 competence protein ComEC [Pontivivens insulae]SPF29313.1 ComE operon protein 3 [Pontivivens insulae]
MSKLYEPPATRRPDLAFLLPLLEPQRRRLVLWVPVFLAAGIALYFALPVEPSRLEYGTSLILGTLFLLLGLNWRQRLLRAATCGAVAAILLGFGLAAHRTHHVAHPVLTSDFYGTVTGTVVGIGRSAGGNPRLLLDDVVLYGGPPVARVRIAFVGQDLADGLAGRRIMVTARIGPPGDPVEPGGFDFRRMAYYERLSGVGYTDATVFIQPDPPRAPVLRARMQVADGLRTRMEAPASGFAAAILTGDRSTVDPASLEDLRASNLAHLLAISGLHMGLLTAFIFACVRGGLALIPSVALRYPIKKWAAVAALCGGAVYLVLSGGAVATQRAFVMTAVVLIAVIIDRPAFTLRGVALAATIILIWRPESLFGAGFQMSFAATAALVAVFEGLRSQPWWRDEGRGWVTRFRAPIALLITSSVAGAATAPIGAFHFGQMSQLGLIANLLAVPIMGMIIMPSAVIAAVLFPLGLDGIPLHIAQVGIETVLGIAGWVAELPGAVRYVPAAPPVVLPLLGGGLCWAVLWTGWGRLIACLPVAYALTLWLQVERPHILIDAGGRMIGVMTVDGRALSRAQGNSFAASTWLENDGDPVGQEGAAARWVAQASTGARTISTNDFTLHHVTARNVWPVLPDCDGPTLNLVTGWQGDLPDLCGTVITRADLQRRGALAIRLTAGRLEIVSVHDGQPDRPWTRDRRSSDQ